MANEKDPKNKKNESGQESNKPPRNANPQPMPDEYSNEANYKGAVDLGTDGTKATASQQQGQGAWNAKDKDESRAGSGDSGGGQASKSKANE
ncbi:hypothetical protein [Pontibacter saemangeumensis]